jgi:hypothetical protein
MNMKKNQTTLEQTLQEWRVTTPLPPRFQEQVWKRIERAEVPSISVSDALWAWLAVTFARPALAVAYVSVLLVVGLAFGFVQANAKAANLDRQLEARYVQSVDPYQRSHQ